VCFTKQNAAEAVLEPLAVDDCWLRNFCKQVNGYPLNRNTSDCGP